MKKIIEVLIRIIIMVAVFCATAVVVNRFMNRNYVNLAIEMKDSRLPVAYVKYEGRYINTMHGYTTNVDTALLRESVTPVDENKNIELVLDDSGEYAEAYSYELRSIAGDSLIESGDLLPTGEENGYEIFDIGIRMDIAKDMEYMLIFKVAGEGDELARYYTRVVVCDDYHADSLLSFTDSFNSATYDGDTAQEDSMITTYKDDYMSSEGIRHDNEDDNLSHVTLASSYDLITWGDLKVMRFTSIIPVIKEIDTNYAVIEYDYTSIEQTTEGDVEYFNVKEYYRVSYDEGNITLMNFDRYVEEYFDRTEIDSAENGFQIGISENSTEYTFSEDNKLLAFVRSGQLWQYNYSEARITLVFGFWLDDVENTRNTYDQHDINIISMDDEGNICFAVYGYMNRGDHEGKLGISLYQYSMEENELDEILFVESNVPYGAMKAELSRLTYYDGNNFYFMLGDKVNCVNVPEKKLSYLVDGVSMSDVSVSDNMEVMAYPSAEAQEDTDSITLVNFKTGNTYTLQAGAGECLKCFDFTGTNLIYGVSDSADSTYSVENDSIIPAKKIYFINESGEEIKEYDKSGYYITDVTVEEDMIYLDRVTAEGQGFVAGDSDFITYKEDQENPGIKESSKAISTGVEKKYLVFPSNIYISYVPKIIITKDKVKDTPVNMVVEVDNESANYMVYDNLGLSGIYETAGDAILYAIQVSGIVISKNGEVVYRKADSLEYNTIASAIFHYSSNSVEKSLQDCLYMTLVYQGGTLDYSDLDSYTDAVTALNELGSYEGVDISGVDLDMVFSYVSNEVPVISRIDDGRYVLIVSYNSESIRYYDPVIGDEVKTTRALYDKSMDLWSRELYSYIK